MKSFFTGSMKKTTRNTTRLIVLIIMLFGAGCSNKPVTTPPQGFIVAYAEEGSSKIRVRWSNDGQNWNDGAFPDHTTSRGVGATSHENGALRMVLWNNEENDIQLLWGLGPMIWDSSPASQSPQQVALSAPTAVYVGGSNRLVAFRTSENMVALRHFNTQTQSFGAINLAPVTIDAQNNQVNGRPSIAAIGPTVLLAWKRSNTLRLAKGVFNGSIVSWSDYYEMQLPTSVDDSYYGGAYSSPALTHDYDNFYIALTRRTIRPPSSEGEFLSREDLYVYSSEDGGPGSWTMRSEQHGVFLDSKISIAGRSDGSLLVGIVGVPGRTSKSVAYRVLGTNWTEVSDLFVQTPKHADFALVSAGPPSSN